MPVAVLHDAVTLVHFAVVGRLDILEGRHGPRPEPRWVEAVRSEIEAGAKLMKPGCQTILDSSWLGDPATPETGDRRPIVNLQVALNEGTAPATTHGGEAESIVIAERTGAMFVTDDNGAFDFARRRLGPGRVKDTVDVLREAVAMDELSTFDALGVANAVRAAGRHLRSRHPGTLTKSYFD